MSAGPRHAPCPPPPLTDRAAMGLRRADALVVRPSWGRNLHATLLLLAPWAAVAGDFINLDFEGVVQPLQFLDQPNGKIISSGAAFPGWSVLFGGVSRDFCLYNSITTGGGSVNLFGTFPPRASFSSPLAGNYSAGLQGSVAGAAAALEQTGTIPLGSQTMTFIGSIGQGLTVSLNGTPAPVVDLGHTATGPTSLYDTYAVDVSALAGQSVQLEFSTTGGARLDNITFSPVALAPEPSTYALFGVGAAALLWFHRRKP